MGETVGYDIGIRRPLLGITKHFTPQLHYLFLFHKQKVYKLKTICLQIMNIDKIFSTNERVKIIKYIIYKIDKLNVSNTAKELKLSKGLVSKYFNILLKERILKKEKGKFVVDNNIKVRGIRLLLNLEQFDTELFRKYKFIQGIGLYGSLTKGTNNEESDIDLWIKIKDTKQMELAKLSNELNKHYKNIKPLFLTKEKIEMLKKEDSLFYYSLIFGSINLYGEELEI